MNKKLLALMKKVQEEHGDGSFARADEGRVVTVKRIPTGIFLVDYATGGGIPHGRISTIYGRKSSGKSAMAAKIVASGQQMCRLCLGPVVNEEQDVEVTVRKIDPETGEIVAVKETVRKMVPVDCANECRVDPGDKRVKKNPWPGRMNVVWIDAEGTFDVPFYKKFGVDTHDVFVQVPDYGEQAVDLGDAAIRTGECDILVVDSIATLIPKKEREDSAEDAQVAVQARLINKMMRNWTASLNELRAQHKTDCCIILINQIRQKISMFPVDVRPGGLGQEFATSLDIRLWQKDYKFDKSGRPLLMNTQFAIEKNKVGTPKMEGVYKMCVTDHPGRKQGDTWDDEVVMVIAKKNGLIVEGPGGEIEALDQEFESEEAFAEEMHKYSDLYRNVRTQLLDLLIDRPSDGELAGNKKKRGEIKV
jgi:RecA/RadA recombinase